MLNCKILFFVKAVTEVMDLPSLHSHGTFSMLCFCIVYVCIGDVVIKVSH